VSDWTAPAFTTALTASLAARAGITDLTDPKVRVLDYWPSADEGITDAIIVGYQAEDSTEHVAIGNQSQDETVTVHCEIRVVRPGAGQTVATACRTRAAFLLGEVADELREAAPDVGDQTVFARTDNRDLVQFPSTAGATAVRVCLIEFDVVYKARTS